MMEGLQLRAGVNLLYYITVSDISSSPDPLKEGERAMHRSGDEVPVTIII